MTVVFRVLAAAIVLSLAACKGEEKTAAATPIVRPVLSMVVTPASERPVGFAGSIQPQFQTDRGFRVLGRIVARNVDVGDIVKVGQTLAQLDPLILDLAVRSNQAELAKARSQLANTEGAENRANVLLGKQVVSQSAFDSAKQARESAAASVLQAEANLTKAREQLGYATLTADIDGVVTAISAEVGQTVTAGKKVMTIARLDIREAVVDLPEDVAQTLPVGAPFEIYLQADPTITSSGKVREIAPQADGATRTRRVKITLAQLADGFRLGATVTALPKAASSTQALRIPRSAVLERDGATRVWLVDPATKKVRTSVVAISPGEDDWVRVDRGLSSGDRLVVAGVNSLSEGQTVKIDEGASP